MHAARVALEIPSESLHPMHAFVCESPTVDREILLESESVGDVTTLLLYVDGERSGYETALSELPYTEEWTVDPAEDDDGFYVYVRAQLRDQERLYADALERESLLVVPPVELRADRTVRLSLVGDGDALSAAMDDLPDALSIEVLRTGTYDRSRGVRLSARQREALTVAWEVGYYDTPRAADLAAVANELDCASSTASDLLRRAERRLVATALDERA
jgi:predicted DNA binding protein